MDIPSLIRDRIFDVCVRLQALDGRSDRIIRRRGSTWMTCMRSKNLAVAPQAEARPRGQICDPVVRGWGLGGSSSHRRSARGAQLDRLSDGRCLQIGDGDGSEPDSARSTHRSHPHTPRPIEPAHNKDTHLPTIAQLPALGACRLSHTGAVRDHLGRNAVPLRCATSPTTNALASRVRGSMGPPPPPLEGLPMVLPEVVEVPPKPLPP